VSVSFLSVYREFEERTISGVKVGDTPTAAHPAPSAVQEYSSLEMAPCSEAGGSKDDTSCGLEEEGQACAVPAANAGHGGVTIIDSAGKSKKSGKGVSSVMV
jgi:hypothetical protein